MEFAKDQRNVLERLIKGLPGIKDYTDKELRRNADARVRQLIADELDAQRRGLLDAQNALLKSGGLAQMGDLDVAITRVSTLADRVRTASYGYAGWFDAVRVQEQELDALRSFDLAMLQEVAGLSAAVGAVRQAVGNPDAFGAAAGEVAAEVDTLTRTFDRRAQAIVSPELLTSPGYAPEVRLPEGDNFTLTTPAAPAEPVQPVPPAAPPASAPPAAPLDPDNPFATSGDASQTPPGFELLDK
jgi:hypothetical protein